MEICKYFWHYFYHSDNFIILKDRKYCINIQNIFEEARKKYGLGIKKVRGKRSFTNHFPLVLLSIIQFFK